MEVKIKLYDGIMPHKQHTGDAAFDLYAPRDIRLKPGRQVIDLGFALELPHGYAATIQPRSGLSIKGMEAKINSVTHNIDADVIRGLVDECYRGHVGVILKVVEPDARFYIIPKGTRIAQMQIVSVPDVELSEVEALSETDRGQNGFGSTGTK